MRCSQAQQLVLDTPWLPIKLSAISEGVTAPQAFQEVLKDRMEMINICRLSLVRKRQHLFREEIVPRPGLSVSGTQFIKCIFGFSMSDDGCVEKTIYNCEDCGAFCCELHTPHSSHQAEVEANPNLVLQQQTSASAASNSLSATSASTSTSGGSKGAKKTPGKNTKPDLIQRYLAVTGRQTLDSRYSKLKVAELKVIVESLERGVEPEIIPVRVGSSVGTSALAVAPPAAVVITPAVDPPVSLGAPHIPPVNLSAADQVMSTFVWTMLQSSPVLRDQLILSTMQGSVASITQGSSSVPIGEKSTVGGGDECASDDDNTFI